ncbi:MAG: PCRF domain-containing protein, partial [Elusimicrobia bacterium]|nr:PCRF domain-containing protein [Elusimicrobiota bacterium]
MNPKIARLDADFREIEAQLSAPNTPSAEVKALSLKHAQMAATIAKVRELARLETELEGLKALASDPEMRAMADEERPGLEARVGPLEQEILLDLLPKDPTDAKNVYLEIRAGA